MLYHIVHTTNYSYDRAIILEPQTIRLRSRTDGTQSLHDFSLKIFPQPMGISHNIDLEGNSVIRVWFDKNPTKKYEITATSKVETYRTNPFDYLLEAWATKLPIDYPLSLASKLQPYLQTQGKYASPDPVAIALAQEIWLATDGQTFSFLLELNKRIHENCQYQIREKGDPLPAGITWKQKQGSCRDMAVLFIETCRAIGLAARFVSGYQQGDPDWEKRYLHAWAEVYLPGAGWRGYDPTQGLAVGDRYIALAASANPSDTTPIAGNFSGAGIKSQMHFHLDLITLDENPAPSTILVAHTGKEIEEICNPKLPKDPNHSPLLNTITSWQKQT